MQLSTTNEICLKSYGSNVIGDFGESIERLHGAGFRTLDAALFMQTDENYILSGDDWQKKVEKAAETAARLGVHFSQSHLPIMHFSSPTMDPHFKTPGYAEYFEECTRRAYIASGMLGVRYATVHPMSYPECNYERKASLEGNHAYYDRYVELGIKHGVGTAFENVLPSLDRAMPHRYCAHYDDLIELVDSYNDPMVAICFDTGHANLMKFDQRKALHAIGRRLKNLHINDNHFGTRDEHLQPFMGEIDWVSFVRGLAEIGYDGDLTYETSKVGMKAFGALQDAFLKMTYQNAEFLYALYLKEKNALSE